jgi:hypothetical protein
VAAHRRESVFFVREVTRLLAVDGRWQPGDLPEVPAGVREVLDQRLARLPAPCRDLLGTAAVAGGEFAVDVVSRAAGRPADEATGLLEAAAAARVLLRPPAPAGHYRFVHDLFRRTVYDALAPADRAARHLAVARTLLRLRSAGRPVSSAELAVHLSSAGPAGAARAVPHAARAAREAAGRFAYEDACGHYRRALAAADLAGTVPPAVRLRLLLGLADALHGSGRTAAAREAYLDAAAGARALGEAPGLARAALGLHQLGTRTAGGDERATDLLAEAVAAVGHEPGPLLPLLLAAQARSSHHAAPGGPPDRATAERAVALARAHGDPGVLAECLLALHDARWQPGTAADRLDVVTEMARCARHAGRRDRYAQAVQLRAAALIELGDPHGPAELTEYCRLAEELRHPRGRWGALTRRATLALLAGRLDEAAELIIEGAALGERIGEPDALGLANCQSWVLAFFGRSLPELRREPYTFGRRDDPIVVALARLAAGDRTGAAAQLAGYPIAAVPRSHDLEPLVYAASIVAEAGSDAQRGKAYEALLPLAGRHCVVGGCASYQGAVDHHLGLLAAALRRPADAAAHLTAAVSLYERLGAPAWAGLASRALAGLAGPSSDGPAPDAAAFRREGGVWSLTYAGRTVRVPDAKGLRDLARLLAAPGRELHVRDLLDAPGPATGADAVLDARARAAYRARLAELAADIDGADAANDPERSARARAERDAVARELAVAVGLGGRERRLADETEKARKTVTARIRHTIARVARVHPALGDHLAASVRTGSRCAYLPDEPVTWRTTA